VFETFLILRRTERDVIINVYWSSGAVPDFNVPGIIWTDFRKNPQISHIKKVRPVGAELFHADGRTDRRTNRHDKAK